MVGLLPGDLVFFNTRRFAFSHVGIYIGHNQFIHAPRPGERVEVSTIDSRYGQRRVNGARRHWRWRSAIHRDGKRQGGPPAGALH